MQHSPTHWNSKNYEKSGLKTHLRGKKHLRGGKGHIPSPASLPSLRRLSPSRFIDNIIRSCPPPLLYTPLQSCIIPLLLLCWDWGWVICRFWLKANMFLVVGFLLTFIVWSRLRDDKCIATQTDSKSPHSWQLWQQWDLCCHMTENLYFWQ